MERNKPGSSQGVRGSKAKITQQPPDLFIALGAKQTTARDDAKRNVPLPKPSSSSHLQASSSKAPDKLKREASSSSLPGVPPTKTMKLSVAASRPPCSGIISIDRVGVEPWEALAIDCDVTELFENIMTAANSGNIDKAVCGLFIVLRYYTIVTLVTRRENIVGFVL